MAAGVARHGCWEKITDCDLRIKILEHEKWEFLIVPLLM